MDSSLTHALCEEIRLQCRLAQRAWKAIPQAILANDVDSAVMNVESFLLACSRVAGLLWPSHPDQESLATEWRKALQVPSDSPLRLEGFRLSSQQERDLLLQWAEDHGRSAFETIRMMPEAMMQGYSTDPQFRTLDPEALKYSVGHQSIALRPLSKGLQILSSSAQDWQRSH